MLFAKPSLMLLKCTLLTYLIEQFRLPTTFKVVLFLPNLHTFYAHIRIKIKHFLEQAFTSAVFQYCGVGISVLSSTKTVQEEKA